MIPRVISILPAIALLLGTGHMAQAQTYTTRYLTASYQDLIDEFLITDSFESEVYSVNIPFTMKLFGEQTPFNQPNGTVAISTQGFFAVDNAVTGSIFVADPFLGSYAPIDETSSLSCSLEGSLGERILKVQWKNMGLVGNPTGDFVNFQLWMYEEDNAIEIRVGDHKITGTAAFNGNGGPSIGIMRAHESFNNITDIHFLIGNPTSPSVDRVNPLISMGRIPPPGSVYRLQFSTGPQSGVIAPALADGAPVFSPNPFTVSTRLQLPAELAGTEIRLYDMLGRDVYRSSDASDGMLLEPAGLAPGVYQAVAIKEGEARLLGPLVLRK